MTDHKPPLHRFTVLDLTRVRAGPTCVRQLADWGANVIKIELPPAPGKEGDASVHVTTRTFRTSSETSGA